MTYNMTKMELHNIDARSDVQMSELETGIQALLKHAFGDSNSSKASRDTLLGACDPNFFKFDFSDLLYLDRDNKRAALTVLNYRILEMDSIERLIDPESLMRLHEIWNKENPWCDERSMRDFAFLP